MLMFINSNSWAETPKDFYNRHKQKKVTARLTFSAMETLVSIMCNEKSPAAARTAAAQAILDRGYGKPSQDIKIEKLKKRDRCLLLAETRYARKNGNADIVFSCGRTALERLLHCPWLPNACQA